MAFAPNTESTLYGTKVNGAANKTSTALSTNIVILVNNTPVGAVQELSINEKREIRAIDEVGTDGHIDSCPTKSTDITGSCKRIRFDGMRIAEAFSRGFIHVSAQVYPFDIYIIDKQRRNTASQITTVIKNVWIGGIDYTYTANDWIISDNMSWTAEAIYSFLPGTRSAATGGVRGIQTMYTGGNVVKSGDNGAIDNIEQLVDRGGFGRRGALDAAGLIDLGDDANLF